MDITLTINGNRNLQIAGADDGLADMLNNPNAEFRVVLICSPTGVEDKFSQGEEPKTVVRKVKVLFVESISDNVNGR